LALPVKLLKEVDYPIFDVLLARLWRQYFRLRLRLFPLT
jgi:hypothetical protein